MGGLTDFTASDKREEKLDLFIPANIFVYFCTGHLAVSNKLSDCICTRQSRALHDWQAHTPETINISNL
jgi:hypothetical protein